MAKSNHFQQPCKHSKQLYAHKLHTHDNSATKPLLHPSGGVISNTSFFPHYREEFNETVLIIRADRPSCKTTAHSQKAIENIIQNSKYLTHGVRMNMFNRGHNTFGILASQDILQGKQSKMDLLTIQAKYTSRKGNQSINH